MTKFIFLSHKEAEVAINKIGEKRLLIEYFKIPEDEGKYRFIGRCGTKVTKFIFLSHKEAEVAINKIGEKRLLIEYFKIPEDEL